MNVTLKRSIAAVALGLAAAAPVLADDITPDPYRNMPSTMSRADVKSQVLAARANGTLKAFSASDSGSFYLSRQPRTSTLTREEVVAEMMAARASGELAAIQSEDSGSAYYAAHRWHMESTPVARVGH
jgi:hypothetical protein